MGAFTLCRGRKDSETSGMTGGLRVRLSRSAMRSIQALTASSVDSTGWFEFGVLTGILGFTLYFFVFMPTAFLAPLRHVPGG